MASFGSRFDGGRFAGSRFTRSRFSAAHGGAFTPADLFGDGGGALLDFTRNEAGPAFRPAQLFAGTADGALLDFTQNGA